MSVSATPNLGLPRLVENQDQANVQINQVIDLLDGVLHLSVKDRDLSAPPGSPAEGDRYLVKATGTGAWAGKDNQVAMYYEGAWLFVTPKEGWGLWVEDEDKLLFHDGTSFTGLMSALDDVVDGSGGTASTNIAAITNLTALTNNMGGSASSTLAAVPDPADSPASADALRDDLAANTLLPLRNNLASLAAQVIAQRAINILYINSIASLVATQNQLKTQMRAAGLLA